MLRKLCTLVLSLAFVVAVTGCAEDEYKVTDKKEVQKESNPTDVSPGTMIVE
jgi:hypothetical protein